MTDELRKVLPRLGPVACGLLLVSTACSVTTTTGTSDAIATALPTAKPIEWLTSVPTQERQEGLYDGWIAFVADLGRGYDLHLLDPGTLEVLPFGLSGLPPGPPAWSPDWSSIAFVGPNDDIYVVEVRCLHRGDCTESLKKYGQSDPIHRGLSWFPNGQSLIAATQPSQDGEVPKLLALSMKDGSASLVLDEGGFNPRVAPRDGRILFDSPLGPDQLMLFDPSTGSIRPLLQGTSEVPNSLDGEWSPDGGKVAFMTTFGEGLAYGARYEVFVADADGASAELLAKNGMYPDWSPDGASIVFEREDGLYVVEVASGNETKILDLPRIHSAPMPAWSP